MEKCRNSLHYYGEIYFVKANLERDIFCNFLKFKYNDSYAFVNTMKTRLSYHITFHTRERMFAGDYLLLLRDFLLFPLSCPNLLLLLDTALALLPLRPTSTVLFSCSCVNNVRAKAARRWSFCLGKTAVSTSPGSMAAFLPG